MKRKILFIDRDGTLVEEPEDFQVDQLNKIKLKPHAISSLLRLKKLNYIFVMITNQDGLGTASFPKESFQICQNFIIDLYASQGIEFDEILICPHFPDDNCNCRKPKTTLLQKYISADDIEWKKCFVIGDRQTDMELAQNLNCHGLLLDKDNSWIDIENEIRRMDRLIHIQRKTKETDVMITVSLNGVGDYKINTGLRFFDHMLEQLAKHSGIDMEIFCKGDLDIDEHHTVEDVAITLGMALKEALGNKKGIQRYGFLLPMDDCLAQAALDLSGRPYFVFSGKFNRPMIGDLPTEMVPHFFRSLSDSMLINLNIQVQGDNTHHMVESCFKALAKALQQAVQQNLDNFIEPTTKGVL